MAQVPEVHRSLGYVLHKLCQGKFLKPKPAPNIYEFGENGVLARHNLRASLITGRLDMLPAKSKEEAMTFLADGKSAIMNNTVKPQRRPIFDTVVQKGFRNQKNLIQFYEVIQDDGSDNLAYQTYLRNRKRFWKNIMFSQGLVVSEETPQECKAVIKVHLTDIEESEIEPMELESFHKIDENFGCDNLKIFHSTLDPDIGTFSMLMDAVRHRQFCKTHRLVLPNKIAPIPLGMVVKEEQCKCPKAKIDIKELARYIELIVQAQQLDMVTINCLDTMDNLGVPFVMVLDRECLNSGIVKVRNRDTNWCENVHLSYISTRICQAFTRRRMSEDYLHVKHEYLDKRFSKPRYPYTDSTNDDDQ